jgi:DNA-binding GntR family transcriptional regulator
MDEPTQGMNGKAPGSLLPHDNRLRKQSPTDIAFNKIKEMVYLHEIVPGQKLMYQELANKLGMSVTPVIQALNRLEFMNILDYERNKGYYVSEISPTELDELFAAREALETFLVPAIVEKLTDAKLRQIKLTMDAHVDALPVPKYRKILMIRDTHFHLKIIECAENQVIYNLSKHVLEQIYLKYRPEYMNDKRLKKAAEEHEEIFSALQNRDVSRTTRLLRQHILNGKKHIVGGMRGNRWGPGDLADVPV